VILYAIQRIKLSALLLMGLGQTELHLQLVLQVTVGNALWIYSEGQVVYTSNTKANGLMGMYNNLMKFRQ
jgi:hypothetical protein